MSDVASQSDEDARRAAAQALAPLRVRGGIRARFHAARDASHITDLGESGGYRVRFPTTHAPHIEAVQINTGGGVAGGDRLAFSFSAALMRQRLPGGRFLLSIRWPWRA